MELILAPLKRTNNENILLSSHRHEFQWSSKLCYRLNFFLLAAAERMPNSARQLNTRLNIKIHAPKLVSLAEAFSFCLCEIFELILVSK